MMSASPPDSKRSIGDVSGDDSHDDKKQHTKVGRKLIETQPKSKRTAQNRAAQRAYRERKERKMKDLEDKVTLLEDEKLRANNEHNMLKSQIERLKAELSRYRGSSDFSDLGVTAPAPGSTPASDVVVGQPWSKTPARGWESTSQPSSVVPDLMSGSSSSTSPLNENVIVSPVSNVSDQDFAKSARDVGLFEEDLDPFCMKLGEACGTKNRPVPKFKRDSEVYPKSGANVAELKKPDHVDSPLHSLFTPNMKLSDPYFSNLEEPAFNFAFDPANTEDPSIFLNDANFDVTLALGNTPYGDPNDAAQQLGLKPEANPLAGLVSEESAYDPLNTVDTNFNFNDFVQSESSRHTSEDGAKTYSSMTSFDSPTVEEPEKEVVPAPEATLQCSEIWQRISSHPRYTDLDIDGLCAELKSKAKCSERGVVLNASDVHNILEKSVMHR